MDFICTIDEAALSGKAALIECPRCLHDEEPADLDIHREPTEHHLDALAISAPDAEAQGNSPSVG